MQSEDTRNVVGICRAAAEAMISERIQWRLDPKYILALCDTVAALSDKQAGEVKIKPLEWKDVDGDIVGLVALARTSFDTYFIERDPEGYVLKLGSIGLLPHQTFEAAKAAAQADYEQRIRSALVDVPAVEAVGYTTEWHLNEVREGRIGNIAPAGTMRPENEMPLYTHPPLSREGEDSAGRIPGAIAAFRAIDVADRLIQSAYGDEVPSEWNQAFRSVAKARIRASALAATGSGSATSSSGGGHG